MSVYWEQNACGFQEDDFEMKVEDEDCVTQKPQIWGNEEKKWMEDSKVKTILTS